MPPKIKKANLRRQTPINQYFNRRRGRPKKKRQRVNPESESIIVVNNSLPPATTTNLNTSTTTTSTASSVITKTITTISTTTPVESSDEDESDDETNRKRIKTVKTSGGARVQWLDPVNFRLMNLAIMMNKNPLMSIESQEKVMMGAPKLTVPRSTLNDCLRRLGDKTEIAYNNCFPTQTRGILLNQQQLQFIKDVIQARDFMNNGMPRHEAIALISDISSSTTKAAENHFDYLIRAGKLPELDKGGRTIVAQATTSDRCMIMLAQ